ncbi:MAG TPA: hypothetical protein VLR27_15875 [Acidimicrobiales bacterium]|nr:hypothetical protein [Acidimicrobiales bacterium]
MMVLRLARAGGLACALAVAIVAGATLGGWWWLAAALAGVGALTGRTGSLVHAVATLVLAGSASVEDVTWLVPLLVLGIVAGVETAALPERATRVRTDVPVAPALAVPVAAAGTAVAVLALATVAPDFAVPTALAATLAAVALLTALRP